MKRRKHGPPGGPPPHIRVIGKDVEVVEDSDALHDEDRVGDYMEQRQRIRYSRNQTDDQLRDTVLHEVIHVVEQCMQLDLEEQQVAGLATGLYAVFRDNPEFIRWLGES